MARRRLRLFRADQWAAEGVDVLNDMYGNFGSSFGVNPNAGQRLALEHVRRSYRRVGPPPPDLDSGQGALSALL